VADEPLVSTALESLGTAEKTIQVVLSNELVHLLSDQLYKSPLKAIEELVVNSYDAGADECFLYVPSPADQIALLAGAVITVFDNGSGMDVAGLQNLWRVGQSAKTGEDIEKRTKRKLIGKFGIGKLATYTIANRLTYVTKSNAGIFAVTTDFRRFKSSGTGSAGPVDLEVKRLKDVDAVLADAALARVISKSQIPKEQLQKPNWTLAVLEELKEKARSIKLGMLRRVLATAMPLVTTFKLYLNSAVVESEKADYTKVVDFPITALPDERLQSIAKATGQVFKREKGRLVSPLFKEGIAGSIFVTDRSLAGKADDLMRSNGFFIRVRGRLINEDDPNFGITAAYGTMNRFRADLDIDDLNGILTASREGIETTELSRWLYIILNEIFNEARQRYEAYEAELKKKLDRAIEATRNYVNPRFVEHPVADALVSPAASAVGAEADDKWFYVDVPKKEEVPELIKRLYNEPRTKYKFIYAASDRTSRLVTFNPITATFTINTAHEFVQAHSDEPRAKLLLEDVVTAEVMLEIYLREASVPPNVIGQVLERRDSLLRSLALDHPFSLTSIASALEDAAANERDLEISLVAAARAIGFVATHISGEGEPDGLAKFIDYPTGPQVITLEAKSSKDVPSLGALDFAGLQQHMIDHHANGCLVVAPAYPGTTRDEDSAASKRARELRVSCWTILQLSWFVKAVETRFLSARELLSIVLTKFAPEEVSAAIDELKRTLEWTMPNLYTAIAVALRELEDRLPDSPRTVSAIAAEVSRVQEFRKIRLEQVKGALVSMAESSKGAMTIRDENVILHVGTAELERRVADLTKQIGQARRESNFRDGPPRTGA
jgi:hypothetical protein